jgi:type I restriction enzyme S subunit
MISIVMLYPYQIKMSSKRSINRIDSDVHNYLKEISLLREYRQSLISEAVTGKIDVRDYPVPTEESMEEAVAKDA